MHPQNNTNEMPTEEIGYAGFVTHGANGTMDEDDIADMYFPPTQGNNDLGLSNCDFKQLIDSELSLFLKTEVVGRGNPLEWWKNNKGMFPHLADLANKFLCSPPSSIESERLFSVGGITYTAKRSRLLPKNSEKMICLNFNLKHFSGMQEIYKDYSSSEQS